MGTKESEFQKRLLETFKVEAVEHIAVIRSGLIELEKAPTAQRSAELVESVFRAAHSLKGAARSVNLMETERLCHELEDIFAAWKREGASPAAELLDNIHSSLDHLERGIQAVSAEKAGPETSSSAQVERLQTAVASPGSQGALPSEPETSLPYAAAPPSFEARTAEVIRVSAARMGTLMMGAEELLGAKLAVVERARELSILGADMHAMRRAFQSGSGDISETLNDLEHRLKRMADAAEHDGRKLDGIVDSLLDGMKSVLMLPFSSLLDVLPKLCRDLARSQGKEVNLNVQGDDVEVDRRVLDEIKDPLIHIIRNCIDHGIEPPEARTRDGKSPKGTVTLSVSQPDASRVELLIADDGRGIDREAIKSAALKQGVLTAHDAESLGSEDVAGLAFQSGVTTSTIITDMSGRGLGLAIVQEAVERLGGTVTIETQAGHGTAFRIVLPVTLATFRAVLVRLGDAVLAFPTLGVEQAVRVTPDSIQTVENRETIRINGSALSLVRLTRVLEMPEKPRTREELETAFAVVLRSGSSRIAFLVDELLDEQEVLVKGLGKQLARVRNIAGAAVLGSGDTVPIVHVQDILKSTVRMNGDRSQTTPAVAEAAKRKHVLVAEDSITSRALLKNILEAAGYHVRTAVDGAEALALLRTDDFDILVSDVEMPRMNGFELTGKIRSDRNLSEMPVVLVTALETREDRERGIEAGANAYIVKSSFDQSNLLEVIRRLI